MNPIIYLIDMLLGIFNFALFVYVVLQLLIYFKVVNPYQPFVAKLWQILDEIFSPILNRIRNILPRFNNFDLSPIVLVVIIAFIRYCLRYYFA